MKKLLGIGLLFWAFAIIGMMFIQLQGTEETPVLGWVASIAITGILLFSGWKLVRSKPKPVVRFNQPRRYNVNIRTGRNR
jgi:hypothetical protein